MKKILIPILTMALVLITAGSWAGDMKVGIGRKAITPQGDAWLNGYANPARLKPATGIAHDLWAKALVFEESPTSRVVIVTTDLLGLSHEISADIAQRLSDKYGIQRSQLLLNSSHTHSAPMVWPAAGMFYYKPDDMQTVYKYTRQLVEDIIAAVDMAMTDLAPMQVWSGHGEADFAFNRRDPKLTIRPVDHDVPVLKIATPGGELKAVLFGYACHNTTLPGDYTEVNGDYAGYAQIELEKMYPGTTALFFQGCCGDINPNPRGTVEHAMQHGKSLAESVQKVLTGTLKPVRAPITTRYETVELEFLPFDLQLYQNDMVTGDEYVQRRAKLMLQAYNKGWDVSKYNYPVQCIRFGKDLTILAMAGEVVVDYGLWAKQTFKNENLFVGGYSNEVMCYIPTKRILDEGGYEANSSMIYYVLPGPFADNVEERIQGAVKQVMKGVGVKPSK
ncbi:neutral/alkaline non-lysosomal ceramidase N-terminal domain-containing protein [Agriterribacter sp.]|uniref:neutral/alkaline non-lysosomal ceramidase N-terminal domain-containing protein n=1 Tax=Agriterribacter sp. TaxID=2821509 RepID=UPI002C99C77F|nr:neutral/alkaline non-lysosomal ceramidase N-terminal domain-containing protein [Agriterribacter sp.]HTN06541.1 neutral/alkaline non-lysosomal ceramidase N-terminal domain-containing protein [Agriterribacter sp.]